MRQEEVTLFLTNLDNLHTTELGIERIKRNASLQNVDVIEWCKEEIRKPDSHISRQGKNWYIEIDNCIITVNAYSYTVITVHKGK